ncbi:hypothetical protein INR49_007507 [Caranx melampygus]|nr:hypothetical protein INR49_020598 [Caranx melampygus]KAG7233082.1 hypothetical protein INR49_007507 [Caranx melampygus]
MDCESQTSLDPPRPGGARAKPQTLDRPDQTRGEQSRARIHQASKRKKKKGLIPGHQTKPQESGRLTPAASTGAFLITFN